MSAIIDENMFHSILYKGSPRVLLYPHTAVMFYAYPLLVVLNLLSMTSAAKAPKKDWRNCASLYQDESCPEQIRKPLEAKLRQALKKLLEKELEYDCILDYAAGVQFRFGAIWASDSDLLTANETIYEEDTKGKFDPETFAQRAVEEWKVDLGKMDPKKFGCNYLHLNGTKRNTAVCLFL
ncbi:hypothetical protein Y032_0005g2681 [Ancylostoma ceylanicum]|uniref:SCP domain-containing protein n=1 Tax=Ancylostoma ceylanicum TaxID=53326 RepID=A0A016VUS3_9BILA|nr:hypothetical protein Y032_0005g2681 [Ancylostoma ceylanicum]